MTAFVYDAVRTPFGRLGGALAGVRPDDLAALVIADLVRRSPWLDPARVDEVIMGDANQAGEDNRNVARMAGLLAGLPTTVPATTVNRLCGSGLDAIMIASRTVQTGDMMIMIAGGVESMSRAPSVITDPDRDPVSTALGWRLVNPRMPVEWTISLGEATEQLAARLGIDRDRQDVWADRSHRLAATAWADGFYAPMITSVPGTMIEIDEGVRPDSSLTALSRLRPAFRDDGTITAGNASPLSDGSAAVLIGSAGAAEVIGRPPVARIAGRGVAATDPRDFGYAPVAAAEQALARAGIGWSDVGAVELNEAFAAQTLACVDAWPVDPAIVNTRGGAIAIGHPLGASGARLVATLSQVLRTDGHRWGVAAVCIGVGQALAVVLENVG